MSSRIVWRVVLVVAVISAAVVSVLVRPVRLGLDLRGGTQIVLEAQDAPGVEFDADTLDRTLEVLRRRVDQLGVAEPTLQTSGTRRIIVELPGVTDPEEALEVIGRTAQLAFHPVLDVAVDENGDGDTPAGEDREGPVLEDEGGTLLQLAPPALTGDAVGRAEAVLAGEFGANWVVNISFRGDGGRHWAELTGDAACEPLGDPRRRIAIVLDEEIISSPEVVAEVACGRGITGGETVITGAFSQEEAQDLALLIRAGALPVPVEVIEQRTVGPTLGEAAIEASIEAALIGGALTIAYVVAFYRLMGVLAAAALLVYGLLSYAALTGIGATLTLPGIAGFVLAIGMAVDANVLVFERAKEEFAAGKALRAAGRDGFRNAWSAILDSNVTTILAAALLFFLASGAVRGFGVTLSLGVAVSMFSALVVTRLLVDLAVRARRLRERPNLFGMRVGGSLRAYFDRSPPDLMGRSRLWFALSGLALVLALTGIFTQGLRFGVEFTGGRLVEFSTVSSVDLDELRTNLADEGFPRAVVQESGNGNVAIRTGRLTDEETDAVLATVTALGDGGQVVRDEFIGPTIGRELRQKALLALTIALAAQLAYLAIRFRWSYGSGAVAALFHDVIILIGIIAWLRKDLDGVFVAALLTVIGYSINDSVVVFDRIREERALQPKAALSRVTNQACLQTLPRTINTGLGALFILIALYLLGGETLTDFALALIIGIVVGSYSSIFTASPAFVHIESRWPSSSPPRSSRETARARALSDARRRSSGG